MQRVKIFVCLSFFLFSVTFYAYQWFAPFVRGQNGITNLSAPTGVKASDGNYSNKIGVNWNTIQGATLYRIFRSTTDNPASAIEVGATEANYFFDMTAVAGQTYFYRVKAENGGITSNFSASDQGFRANGNVAPGPFPPLGPPPAPAGNEITATKAYLGKALFWDEQLSSTRTVSCGTCHRPGSGGSDPRTIFNDAASRNPGFDNVAGTADDVFGSPGVPGSNADGTYSMINSFGFGAQVTPRKAPSYLNAGYTQNGLFWDGRAQNVFRDPITDAIVMASGASLESQVLGPPVNSGEMAHGGRNWTQVAERISESKPLALATNIPNGLKNWIGGRSYPQLFEEAFGTPEVTPARIAMAIATHERTLFSDQTPLDKWAMQIEPLTTQEEIGRSLFVRLQCNTCHDGSLLTDNLFHNIGVRPASEDKGRGIVTGNADDDGKFRTPNLRNVELHAPYMHNGRFATLEEVVDFYDRGGDFDAPNIDHGVIRPLNLAPDEKTALVAFMKRPLTDPRVRDELPPFDRPTLYTESNRVPLISGTGRAGTGGIFPKAVAIEPPLVGNPSFTVAVSDGLANAQAVLVIDESDPGIGTSVPASGAFARQTVNLSADGSGSVSLAIPNNPALVGRTFFGRWYITDGGAADGFAVSQLFSFKIFGEASAAGKTHADFDGDGKTDVAVFRPDNGVWYISNSSDGNTTSTAFGFGTDILVPADYDGDGKTDIAIFRNGFWYLLQSSAGFTGVQFGAADDKPVIGDYDGDGKTDIAVFRPSNGTWYLLQSTAGFAAVQFGQAGDRPVAADYDGDGNTDIAVYRDGFWYLLQSTDGFAAVHFGAADDKPVIGDYDGDGKADIAVFRPSTGSWYYLNSSDNSFSGIAFGFSTDIPSPGDYDGDGKTDIAVFRASEGNWYILNSGNGSFRAQTFGASQDLSIPAAIVP